MSARRANITVTLLAVGLTLALVALLGRIAQLQLAPDAPLREHLEARVAERRVPALRGELLDARGRVLATSQFGYRAFVDPARLATLTPGELDAAIVRIARATNQPAQEVGRSIYSALVANERRREASERDPEAKSQIRFVPVSPVLDHDRVERVRALDVPGLHLEQRAVRTYPGGEIIAPIVGKVGFEHEGRLGAEYALDQRLKPRHGSIRYVRDAGGRPLWVEPGDWRPGQSGRDVRLSIDLRLQQIAAEELARGIEQSDAAGGRLVIIEPDTGEILAMVDQIREVEGLAEVPWEPMASQEERSRARAEQASSTDPASVPAITSPVEEPLAGPSVRYRTIKPDPRRDQHPALGRNRCVEDIYEPGSTFKPFVWAEITARGLADPEEIINTEGGRWRTPYGRSIEDVSERDRMTWAEVLLRSSNIGMVKTGRRLDHDQAHALLGKLGFGRSTGLGLPGEASGITTNLGQWNKYTHTSICFGHEIAVTPLQMVRAFSAFARNGQRTGSIPELSLRADPPERGRVRYRVWSKGVCLTVRDILAGVAAAMERRMAVHFPDEGPWNYRIFGKSGTADVPLGPAPEGFRRPAGWSGYFEGQYNSSFIAGGPIERPRLVALVVIDDPGPSRIRTRRHYGSHTAGPVVRRVLERSLAYLGVPPSPEDAPSPASRVPLATDD